MMNAVLSPGRGKRNSSGRTLIMCTGEVTMMGIRLLGVHFSFRSIGVLVDGCAASVQMNK